MNNRRSALTTSLALTLLLSTLPPPTARLEVEHAPGVPLCTDAEVLESRVAVRLKGRTPFSAEAERLARVVLSRSGRTHVAEITVTEPDGRRGVRQLEDRSCDELVEAVALALAIAIDPRRAYGLEPAAPHPRRTAEPALRRPRAGVAESAPVTRPPPRAKPVDLALAVGLSVDAHFGDTPDLGLGPGLRLELAGSWWRALLAMELAFTAPTAVAHTLVGVTRIAGRAATCWSGSVLVCLGVTLGREVWSADQGLTEPIEETRQRLSLEAAVGVDVASAVRLELGLAIPLGGPAALTLDGERVWRSWPLAPSARIVLFP